MVNSASSESIVQFVITSMLEIDPFSEQEHCFLPTPSPRVFICSKKQNVPEFQAQDYVKYEWHVVETWKNL